LTVLASKKASEAHPLRFIDLLAQRHRLGHEVDAAILRVLDHGQFILGPEVRALEAELSRFCGAKEVISCANGTDALGLVLMAREVGPGDAVLCPSFTFAATAEVVVWLGATPVYIDVDPTTFNLDAKSLEQGIATAKQHGLKPVGLIAVDLFGQPADYDTLEPVCAAHGLWLLSDAAQSFGASYRGRKVGTIGLATATSFFPSKPLACYGDGGAIFTDDAELAKVLRSLRVHGEGVDKYDNVRIGMNGRLDTIQAAILLEKLKIFPDEIERRDRIVARYNEALADVATVPVVPEGSTSVWAQYTIKVDAEKRDKLVAALKEEGIPTAVYYPKPLHRQTAYKQYPSAGNGLPVSELVAGQVVSLPLHPYLESNDQDRIVEAVRRNLQS
jgi:dTDP-4-amino-4,6-dideoxygalactose transaminase